MEGALQVSSQCHWHLKSVDRIDEVYFEVVRPKSTRRSVLWLKYFYPATQVKKKCRDVLAAEGCAINCAE